MNPRKGFQQKRPWNMCIFEVWDQEYMLYLKVYQYSVWKRFSCKRTQVFEILLIQRQDMGRTEDRACSFKSDNMVSSPAPSLSYQSRTQIWRQLFLLVDLESPFVYTVLFTVESFISDLQIVFIFVVTVWQFFCTVGFKVFSAIRASRLQLLM